MKADLSKHRHYNEKKGYLIWITSYQDCFICPEKFLSAYSIGLRRNGLGSIDVSFEIRIYVTHVPRRITCQLGVSRNVNKPNIMHTQVLATEWTTSHILRTRNAFADRQERSTPSPHTYFSPCSKIWTPSRWRAAWCAYAAAARAWCRSRILCSDSWHNRCRLSRGRSGGERPRHFGASPCQNRGTWWRVTNTAVTWREFRSASHHPDD